MPNAERGQAFLAAFRDRFEPALEAYLQEKIRSLREIDALGAVLAAIVGNFTMESGKRLRAALVSLGYRALGNDETAAILQPAIAVELLHSFFLIHDDLIDRSELRRSRPTVHRVFSQHYAYPLRRYEERERDHVAASLGILTGDLCCAMGYEALTNSQFPAERVLAATRLMHGMMDATVVGEALDVLVPVLEQCGEQEVLTVHRLKTALYTFAGPLQLGMCLGGATEDQIKAVHGYAVPVGIAFQIQDDILGLFGTEEELGKPISSDLAEGKQTLLTTFALAHASRARRDRLLAILGSSAVTRSEVEEARVIIRSSGGLAYAQQRARAYVAEGLRGLDALACPDDVRTLLGDIAAYVIARTV